MDALGQTGGSGFGSPSQLQAPVRTPDPGMPKPVPAGAPDWAGDLFQELDEQREHNFRVQAREQESRVRERMREGAAGGVPDWPIASGIQTGILTGVDRFVRSPIVRLFDSETADEINRESDAMIEAPRRLVDKGDGYEWQKGVGKNMVGVSSSITGMLGMAATGGAAGLARTGTMAFMAGGFGVSEANESYTRGLDAGLSHDKSRAYAAKMGVIEGGVMMAFHGLGRLAPGLGGVEDLFIREEIPKRLIPSLIKEFGVRTIGELTEENITSILQTVTTAMDIPGAKDAANWTGPDGTVWNSPMMDVLRQTTYQTLMTMGIVEAATGRGRYKHMQMLKNAERLSPEDFVALYPDEARQLAALDDSDLTRRKFVELSQLPTREGEGHEFQVNYKNAVRLAVLRRNTIENETRGFHEGPGVAGAIDFAEPEPEFDDSTERPDELQAGDLVETADGEVLEIISQKDVRGGKKKHRGLRYKVRDRNGKERTVRDQQVRRYYRRRPQAPTGDAGTKAENLLNDVETGEGKSTPEPATPTGIPVAFGPNAVEVQAGRGYQGDDEQEKRTLEDAEQQIQEFAGARGAKVRIVDAPDPQGINPPGLFSPDGTIWIARDRLNRYRDAKTGQLDPQAMRKAIVAVFIHEYTHHLQRTHPGHFGSLVRTIQENFKGEIEKALESYKKELEAEFLSKLLDGGAEVGPATVQARQQVQDHIAAYGAQHGLVGEAAEEAWGLSEGVAVFIQDNFMSYGLWSKFARTNTTAFQRFVDWFKRLYHQLSGNKVYAELNKILDQVAKEQGIDPVSPTAPATAPSPVAAEPVADPEVADLTDPESTLVSWAKRLADSVRDGSAEERNAVRGELSRELQAQKEFRSLPGREGLDLSAEDGRILQLEALIERLENPPPAQHAPRRRGSVDFSYTQSGRRKGRRPVVNGQVVEGAVTQVTAMSETGQGAVRKLFPMTGDAPVMRLKTKFPADGETELLEEMLLDVMETHQGNWLLLGGKDRLKGDFSPEELMALSNLFENVEAEVFTWDSRSFGAVTAGVPALPTGATGIQVVARASTGVLGDLFATRRGEVQDRAKEEYESFAKKLVSEYGGLSNLNDEDQAKLDELDDKWQQSRMGMTAEELKDWHASQPRSRARGVLFGTAEQFATRRLVDPQMGVINWPKNTTAQLELESDRREREAEERAWSRDESMQRRQEIDYRTMGAREQFATRRGEVSPWRTRQSRDITEMPEIIPNEIRGPETKGNRQRGKPRKRTNGRSWFLELDPMGRASAVDLSQADLTRALEEARSSIDADPEVVSAALSTLPQNDLVLPSIEKVSRALTMPNVYRYWYERFVEVTATHPRKRRFAADQNPSVSWSQDLLKKFYGVTAATSAQADVEENMLRALATMSEHLRGQEILTPTTDSVSVRKAIFDQLEGLKIGSFMGTFRYLAGYTDLKPLPTLDTIMAQVFGIKAKDLTNGVIYEYMSRFMINLTDHVNQNLKSNVEPFTSWQLQALLWSQHQLDQAGKPLGTTYPEVIDFAIQQLAAKGVQMPINAVGEPMLTPDALAHAKTAEILQPQITPFKESVTITQEVIASHKPQHDRALRNRDRLLETGDASHETLVHTRPDSFTRAQTRAMSATAQIREGYERPLHDDAIKDIQEEEAEAAQQLESAESPEQKAKAKKKLESAQKRVARESKRGGALTEAAAAVAGLEANYTAAMANPATTRISRTTVPVPRAGGAEGPVGTFKTDANLNFLIPLQAAKYGPDARRVIIAMLGKLYDQVAGAASRFRVVSPSTATRYRQQGKVITPRAYLPGVIATQEIATEIATELQAHGEFDVIMKTFPDGSTVEVFPIFGDTSISVLAKRDLASALRKLGHAAKVRDSEFISEGWGTDYVQNLDEVVDKKTGKSSYQSNGEYDRIIQGWIKDTASEESRNAKGSWYGDLPETQKQAITKHLEALGHKNTRRQRNRLLLGRLPGRHTGVRVDDRRRVRTALRKSRVVRFTDAYSKLEPVAQKLTSDLEAFSDAAEKTLDRYNKQHGTQFATRRLATPGLASPAAEWSRDVGAARPIPAERADAEVHAEAQAAIDAHGMDALIDLYGNVSTVGDVSDAANRLGILGDSAVYLAREVITEAGRRGLEGDTVAMANAAAILDQYYDVGTEQARMFRQRRNHFEDPIDRRVAAVTDAIFTPPEKVKKQVKAAKKAGNTDAAKKLIKDWAGEADKIVDQLQDLGYDIRDKSRPLGEVPGAGPGRGPGQGPGRGPGQGPGGRGRGPGGRGRGPGGGGGAGVVVDPKRTSRLIRDIETLKKDKQLDVLYEYWRNSILSAPTTQIANIMGTVPFAAFESFAMRPLEASLRWFMPKHMVKDAPYMAEIPYVWAGMVGSLGRAVENAFEAFRTEVPVFEPSLGRGPGAQKVETPRVSIKRKYGGEFIRMPQRLLLFFDELMKTVIAHGEVAGHAYRIARSEGASGPALTTRMQELTSNYQSRAWDRAIDQSLRTLFQSELGRGGKAIVSLRASLPGGQFLMPFIVTPINILKRGVEYTPLATLMLPMEMMTARKTGDWSKVTPAMARQAVAWVATMLIMSMNDEDEPLITGSRPEWDMGARGMSRRRGQPPAQSIRMGDTWVSYRRVEPIATTLASVVDWVNAFKSDDPSRMSTDWVESLGGLVQQKTFLQGIGDFLDMVREPRERGAYWSVSFATSWWPNIFRSAGRATQAEYQERRIWGEGSQYLDIAGLRAIQKLELGIKEDLPRVDLWGRSFPREPNHEPLTDWGYKMLIPFAIKGTADAFIGDEVLRRWNNQHPEEPQYPRPPSKKYETPAGVEKQMSPDQYHEFSSLSGKLARELVALEILDTTDPSEEDIKTITSSIRDARKVAKDILVKKWDGQATPEQSVEDLTQILHQKHVASRARKLAANKPTRKGRKVSPQEFQMKVEEWRENRDEAREWLQSRGVSIQEAMKSHKISKPGRARMRRAGAGR